MQKRIILLIAAYISAILFVSCSSDEEKAPLESEKIQEDVFASVNGTSLTDDQLDFAVTKLLGNQFVDARTVFKIRESLVSTRALSLKAEKELDSAQIEAINIAVAAYREERLVAALIEQTAVPEPVSSEDVARYYSENLEQFGQRTSNQLELLKGDVQIFPGDANLLATQMTEIRNSNDWGDASKGIQGIELITVNSSGHLSEKLQSAVNKLSVGERTQLIIEDSQIYVVKLNGVETIPAKPLTEVSASIRKRLAAKQLSAVIKSMSEQALSESDVVRNY